MAGAILLGRRSTSRRVCTGDVRGGLVVSDVHGLGMLRAMITSECDCVLHSRTARDSCTRSKAPSEYILVQLGKFNTHTNLPRVRGCVRALRDNS